MINQYLQTRYVKGGRGPFDCDCWGLVRMARAELFGRGWLPSFSQISPDDKGGLTQACEQVRLGGGFIAVRARPGAIATAWAARLCVHVGIVVEADGRLWILETDQGSGPCLTSIPAFEARYTRVVFYDDDQNLS